MRSLDRQRTATHRTAGRLRGFTLLELLVALVVLAFISTALAAAVRSVVRITQASEARTAFTQDLRTVGALLARDIRAMVPLTSVDRSRRLAHIAGDGRRLRLVAEAPSRFRPGGLYEVVYETRPAPNGTELVMSRRLIHPDVMRTGGTSIRFRNRKPDDERVLLSPGEVRFAYFGRQGRTTRADWHERWDGAWGPPTLVRAEITQGDEVWPPLVVRPQIRRGRFQSLNRGGNAQNGDVDEAQAEADAAIDSETACIGDNCQGGAQ